MLTIVQNDVLVHGLAIVMCALLGTCSAACKDAVKVRCAYYKANGRCNELQGGSAQDAVHTIPGYSAMEPISNLCAATCPSACSDDSKSTRLTIR